MRLQLHCCDLRQVLCGNLAGDILALIGAIGITPIDFILPCAMYLKVYKPHGVVLLVNIAIITVYTFVGIMGAISAIRGIVNGETHLSQCDSCS